MRALGEGAPSANEETWIIRTYINMEVVAVSLRVVGRDDRLQAGTRGEITREHHERGPWVCRP